MDTCNHDGDNCAVPCEEQTSVEECTHDCSTCSANCPSKGASAEDFRVALHELSSVKKVIGVVSGKGGVGKSLVSAMMAVSMQRRGHHSAILDADVTGPSIPNMFGVKGVATADEFGIIPKRTKTGIDVISANLLLEDAGAPIVWRGAMISNPGAAILEPGNLERCRLSVCRYASWDGRRTADGVPVFASGWHHYCDFPAGTCLYDRWQGRADGGANEHSDRWACGEYELSQVPGLRKGNSSVRRQPYRFYCG